MSDANTKHNWSSGLRLLLVPVLTLSFILISVMAAYNIIRTPKFFEPDNQLLTASFAEANQKTKEEISGEVEAILDHVYEPVYSSIPSYLDFHYSIAGEYIELTQGALNAFQLDMGTAMQERMFGGLDARLSHSAELLDAQYDAILQRKLLDQLVAAAPENLRHLPLGPVAQMGIDDALDRAIVTQPIALSAAGLIASARTVMAQQIADVMIKKLAQKAVSKGITKGGQIGAGAIAGGGAGAAGGLACGPGAPFCSGIAGGIGATIGAIIAWLAVDHATIKIDELLHREEFEQSIEQLVSDHKTQMRQNLIDLLDAKAAAIEKSIPLYAFYNAQGEA